MTAGGAGGAVISVPDLHRSYGRVEAVRGVTFDVRQGEVFGLLGPNGAGKTTILETIEGLRPVQRGHVTVAGVDVAREPARVSRMIGVQLQQTAFFARLLFTVHLDLLSIFLVGTLGYLVFLATGFAISGWIRDAQRAPAIATSIGMPMIFIGLFPPSLFSGTAAAVVGTLPVSYVTHGIRTLVEGGDLGAIRLDLLGLAAWAAVLLAAASRAFRWDD